MARSVNLAVAAAHQRLRASSFDQTGRQRRTLLVAVGSTALAIWQHLRHQKKVVEEEPDVEPRSTVVAEAKHPNGKSG